MSDEAKHENPIPAQENEVSTLDLHQQAMKETDEPYESMFAGPKWFYLLVVIAAVVAAFYYGRHMGKLDTAAHIGFLQKQNMQQAQNTATATPPQVSGAAIFTTRCSACHQADGKGVPGAFPPLVGSAYVLGKPEVVVRILLQGLHGEITVEDKKFNGVMPPWGAQLKDEEIAAVINHIRSELGTNKASTIAPELVKSVRDSTKDRQGPWTADELNAVEKS